MTLVLQLSIFLMLTCLCPNFSSSSHQKALQIALKSSVSGSSKASRTTLISFHPKLLSFQVLYRALLLYKPSTPTTFYLLYFSSAKQLCNNDFSKSAWKQGKIDALGQVQGLLKESRRLLSFFWMISGARSEETLSIKLKYYRIG